MSAISFKKEIEASVEEAVHRIEQGLKSQGFGILTRIDFDKKIKEKLNKDISPVVILGACNPKMAYETFLKNKDVTALMPCNVVISDLGQGKVSIELAKPSVLLAPLLDKSIETLGKEADAQLSKVLESI